MSHVNELLRKRIGLSMSEEITLQTLPTVLEKIAKEIPFENVCIIDDKTTEITDEYVKHKILNEGEGGLCYELNYLLYLFLTENDFHTKLVRGVVFDQVNQKWGSTGRTHVANVITVNGEKYIVDTGFGANLPLKPVPLTGDIVISSNGEFRIEKKETEFGDYIFYMKLNHKHHDWKIGYSFHSEKDAWVTDLNEVQKIIIEHPESPFNKKPLLTKITDRGSIVLTEGSFTEWINGEVRKEEIDSEEFFRLRKCYFGF